MISDPAPTPARYRFESFILDTDDRKLLRDGQTVELNSRYLDALVLLVREQGRLVSKDRFLEEVWRGVPVTDEALTQCIRTLRRQLGDNAMMPRFIETVPKHGYRFIAGVQPVPPVAAEGDGTLLPARRFALTGSAGTLGGGLAGLGGGLFYGLAGATQPLQPAMGTVSVLLVILALTIVLALIGGAGVGFGIAGAQRAAGTGSAWSIGGGALGGSIVGAIVKLLGLDALNLLFGRAPADMTGAVEGAILGGAVGLAVWLANRWDGSNSLRRSFSAAAVTGGLGGTAIALMGGRLMGGSLDMLARSFPGSRLRLDRVGPLFGETGFGPVSQAATAALEGALFSACVVGAMLLARRTLDRSNQ